MQKGKKGSDSGEGEGIYVFWWQTLLPQYAPRQNVHIMLVCPYKSNASDSVENQP